MANQSADDWVPTAGVRQIFGGVSAMTIWRWSHGAGFPPPDLIIRGRKFWRRETIESWINEQSRTNPNKPVSTPERLCSGWPE
jgi:predicted DNA-binding transcriptional regulator AlpA